MIGKRALEGSLEEFKYLGTSLLNIGAVESLVVYIGTRYAVDTQGIYLRNVFDFPNSRLLPGARRCPRPHYKHFEKALVETVAVPVELVIPVWVNFGSSYNPFA